MNDGSSIQLHAIKTEQWGTQLYVGVAPASKVIEATEVDYYDPKLDPADKRQGYQRPPERSRITRIGSFLLNPDNGERPIFPTAVLLASRKPLAFTKAEELVSIPRDSKLQIVDGQHRLAGLEYVIKEKGAKEFEAFPVPFVILETRDKLQEMTQFRVVNGTAKSVRTDLVNMILTATYTGREADIPSKDKWKIVVSNVVDRLAKEPDSVWRGTIILPGEGKIQNTIDSLFEDGKEKVVRATSFITSLKPVYDWLSMTLLEHKTRTVDQQIDYLYRIVNEYWQALKQVVPAAFEEPDKYVIQKTPGLFSLHKLLKHLLNDMHYGRREFDKKNFVEFLSMSPEVTDPEFWSVDGNRASVYGSMKGFQELYELIREPYLS